MKIEDVKGLADAELEKFVIAGVAEQKARAERKKQETISKIKEMAATVGVTVVIEGGRGRPRKPRAPGTSERASAQVAAESPNVPPTPRPAAPQPARTSSERPPG